MAYIHWKKNRLIAPDDRARYLEDFQRLFFTEPGYVSTLAKVGLGRVDRQRGESGSVVAGVCW